MTLLIAQPILAFVFAVAIGAQTSPTQGWRGIVPLKSTRADVERLLGAPTDKYLRGVYPVHDGSVTSVNVYYSEQRCDDGWNVAPETVTTIVVYPKERVPLAELKLDLTKYDKEVGDHDVSEHFYYRNHEQGLTLSVLHGIVQSYIYKPTVKDNVLRCPKSGSSDERSP